MSKAGQRKNASGGNALHPETLMMSYGYDPFLSEGSVKPPMFLTSTFAFRSAEEGAECFDRMSGRTPVPAGESAGLVYSRFNHPNLQLVEDRLAVLDGAEAAAVMASGMAAISAVLLAFLRPGDQIVMSAPLYGGTETLITKILSEWGIGSQAADDGLSAEAFRQAMETAAQNGPLRICYVETPANPTNGLVDLDILHAEVQAFEMRHGYRPLIVCDNTMLGPIFQQPLRHGVDLNVYSLTKYVGGHSDLVAGGVTGSKALIGKVRAVRGAYGSQLDPHSCWMIARSMETLVIRMQRAAATGSKVARWLAENPWHEVRVFHLELIDDIDYQNVYRRQCSGPGSTFSFVLPGGREQAFRFINALTLFKSAVSLGGSESLVCHPASTTHSGVAPELREWQGVSEGLVRVSIGLEHEDDLVADLDQALQRC